MYKLLFLLFFVAAACTSKEPIPQGPDILALKEISDLATVEYTITKIIKANDNKTWFKVGNRKILMSCEGTIKAGVDLSLLTKDDFVINDTSINLRLPPPKIISLNIPPEKIKVEYQEIGVFRDPFKTQERDELAAQAENQIKNSLNELGILEQAKANTSLFVSNFLHQLGYRNIIITYGNSSSKIQLP